MDWIGRQKDGYIDKKEEKKAKMKRKIERK